MLSKFLTIQAHLGYLTVGQIDDGEYVAVGYHIPAYFYLKIQRFGMEDNLVFLLLLSLLTHIELRLRSPVGIERVFADKFEVPFVLHAFPEDDVVFDGGLLLADPPRVDLITESVPSCLALSSLFFFSCRKMARSSDLTNSLDLGKLILGRYLMMEAILNGSRGTC